MRSFLSLLVPAAVLVCVGAGCAGSATPAVPPTPTSTAASVGGFPTFVAPTKQPTPKEELSAILESYNATKSYRARITAQTKEGTFVAVMEFSKPNRFHALIRTAPKNDTEIIIVDNSMYMRPQSEDWIDVSTSKSSRALSDAMKSSVTDSSLHALVLTDAVTVERTEDTVRSCTQLTARIMENDTTRDVSICAVNGLPKYVDMSKEDGYNSIEYFDYNAVFSILKPLP